MLFFKKKNMIGAAIDHQLVVGVGTYSEYPALAREVSRMRVYGQARTRLPACAPARESIILAIYNSAGERRANIFFFLKNTIRYCRTPVVTVVYGIYRGGLGGMKAGYLVSVGVGGTPVQKYSWRG